MVRLSVNNPRFRSKEQIAADVAFILTAPISYGTKYSVVSQACWAWTEFDGKYFGCRFWSKKALVQAKKTLKKDLRHEHLVPRKVLVAMLMEVVEPTPEKVRELLDQFCIGVVVTKAEDELLSKGLRSRMPREFDDPQHEDYRDPWLRYRRCGIAVVDMNANDLNLRSSKF